MIRVGLVYSSPATGWLGGVSYLRNLFATIKSQEVGIELVALVSAHPLESDPGAGASVIRTSLFKRRSPLRWLRLAVREATGRDWVTERFLRANGIQVLSHSGVLGIGSRVPAINWIPDLQHRYLPGFFEPSEIRSRDRGFGRLCHSSTLVIASSDCARRGLETFFPEVLGRVRVLRFIDTSATEVEPDDQSSLERRYHFSGPYFFVPNQFWIHKNHGVIIEALRVLRSRGRRVQVLATGNTSDYRRPDYFSELMQRRAEAGVESEFRCLGMVPYKDVANLARGAVSLINPSLFEGWSTSVEEAKSLGKAILLSDIDVHREQDPERGVYFPPNDAEALADLMWKQLSDFNPEQEKVTAAAAKQRLPGRRSAFAQMYASIVEEAMTIGASPMST